MAVHQNGLGTFDRFELRRKCRLVIAEHHGNVVEPQFSCEIGEPGWVHADRSALHSVVAGPGLAGQALWHLAEVFHTPITF